jgi:hypothetical protein
VRARVEAARARQRERYRALPGVHANGQLRGQTVREMCRLSREAARTLRSALESLRLSARAHDRTVKVARTIADLEGAEIIGPAHVTEAIQYRALDRALRESPELPPQAAWLRRFFPHLRAIGAEPDAGASRPESDPRAESAAPQATEGT